MINPKFVLKVVALEDMNSRWNLKKVLNFDLKRLLELLYANV